MNFINCKCVKCGVVITKDDEVTVCHICGSPHHSACFTKHDICANTDKHSETFAYKKDGRRRYVNDDGEFENQQPAMRQCGNCGYINTADQVNCVRCGRNFASRNNPRPQMPAMPFLPQNPLKGVNAREKIEDVTLGEMSVVVMINVARYIPKFNKMNREKRKYSWNWAAFLFGGLWFLHRKCYAVGMIVLTLFLSALFLVQPTNTMAAQLRAEHGFEEASQLLLPTQLENPIILLAFLGGLALIATLHIISGIFGDYIYKKSVIKRAKTLRNADQNAFGFAPFKNPIGVSRLSPLLGFWVVRFISALIAVQ